MIERFELLLSGLVIGFILGGLFWIWVTCKVIDARWTREAQKEKRV